MSPQPPQHDSDSEDDDYVPPVEADSDSSDEEPETKRNRTCSPKLTEDEEAAKKMARESLWADFQASVSTPPPQKAEDNPKKLVKITKRYRFAGEDVVETVEVPEDSQDAKKWPRWQPSEQTDSSISPAPPHPSTTAPDAPPIASASTSTVLPHGESSKPSERRPGPRKPKISLTALPGSSSQKAKKITTLDKSAMDWRAHINADQESSLKDELEANRRGGGYLEKVEFLKRVEERKDNAIEASKGNKRRRPY